MQLALVRGSLAALALALVAACGDTGNQPPVDADPTPTGPSSAPLPSVDSAPGGGGGGPGAGDQIGTGAP